MLPQPAYGRVIPALLELTMGLLDNHHVQNALLEVTIQTPEVLHQLHVQNALLESTIQTPEVLLQLHVSIVGLDRILLAAARVQGALLGRLLVPEQVHVHHVLLEHISQQLGVVHVYHVLLELTIQTQEVLLQRHV
jgi:hypothetical protein